MEKSELVVLFHPIITHFLNNRQNLPSFFFPFSSFFLTCGQVSSFAITKNEVTWLLMHVVLLVDFSFTPI